MDGLVVGEGGYHTDERPLFRTLRVAQPGTVELRRCYSSRLKDHMVSLDAYNECPRAGYVVEGVLGYVYPQQVPNSVHVYRCYNGYDGLTALDPRECTANGHRVEGEFWAF
jgi:hypothetical protein